MGQGEILKILKKFNKPMTSSEISQKLNKSKSCVATCCKKLAGQGEVIRRLIKRDGGYYIFLYELKGG